MAVAEDDSPVVNEITKVSKLSTLRSQLTSLRRARAGVRWATAWSSVLTAITWGLATVFLLDFLFELAIPQRMIVILLAAAAVAWAGWTFTRPLLGIRESDIDMALMVERQQEIDSDLVAALQFESPAAARWGSVQLESAVIDYVAAVGRGINVFEGFSREQMVKRASLLGVSLLVALAIVALFPRHTGAFFNRLLLGSRHYPTSTIIEQIAINERIVLDPADVKLAGQSDMRPAPLTSAQGRPLSFAILASGDLPSGGVIRLQSAKSRSRTTLALKKLPDADAVKFWSGRFAPALEESGRSLYVGELPRLLEDVRYQAFLGDAWTDPAQLRIVPLPVVEPRLTPVYPKYAQSRKQEFDPSGRQWSVLEGTSIKLAAHSVNKKPLKSAWLTVTTKNEPRRYDLVRDDAQGLTWSLPETNSPLANIRGELRYELQVVDVDGLSLESPLRGNIRIRPDRPPTGSAEVVHKVVLPSAEPIVEYRATDDYGISKLSVLIEVERFDPARAAGETIDLGAAGQIANAEEVPAERHELPILAREPVMAGRLPLAGEHRLSLSPLKLAKGDRVKVVLEITDYRGEDIQGRIVGQKYTTDPLLMEISDESGVLAAVSEADPRSEQRLTDIIKRQLGIGETP